jgi:hypothetical protein
MVLKLASNRNNMVNCKRENKFIYRLLRKAL